MQTLSSYCHGDGRKANTKLNYEENVRGEELKKKVMMTAAVLCLGLLLGIGSRMASSIGKTKAYNMLAPTDVRIGVVYLSGWENEEKLIPFSSSGKTGMYVIPGPFEGPYGRSWADFVISAGTNWGDFPSPMEEEEEKILNELTVFCNGHKEKLNEMSEYFVNAVEDISDYQDEERLPDIEELASVFTDEESRKILEKLEPYYPIGFDADDGGGLFKRVYYRCPYDYPVFTVVYLKADQEKLMNFFSASYFWTTQKIDKYLFVVMEKPEHWY